MRICCVILAGGNREDKIGAAVESALGLVDTIILIDTDAADAAIVVVRGMIGTRCVVVKLPDGMTSTSERRTFCLAVAHELGFDACILLDTDERLIWCDANEVWSEVERAREHGAYWCMTWNDLDAIGGNSYPKARFFWLPAVGRYDGIAHEAFVANTPGALLKSVTFHEVPKTPSELEALTLSVAETMRTEIRKEPGNSRWHFYLADSLCHHGRFDEAIESFRTAALLTGWDEERDWSWYRIALIYGEQRRYAEAIEALQIGGVNIPEQAWYLAYCCHRSGQNDRAVYWAQKSARIAEEQRDRLRIGFSYRFAQFEGPFNVLDHAYRALGETKLADEAKRKTEEMIALRRSGLPCSVREKLAA
jgi:tetratricopeptide (TPR) repeat protein